MRAMPEERSETGGPIEIHVVSDATGETATRVVMAVERQFPQLEFEVTLTPDGHVPGAHVHPEQQERFEVLEGTMKFRLGLRTIKAGPGETVVVPAGRVHRFANGGDEPCRARVQVTPALDMEDLLVTTTELALEGNVTRKGMPKPLHLALFVRRFEREVRLHMHVSAERKRDQRRGGAAHRDDRDAEVGATV